MYFNKKNYFFHGIMFHHFHDNKIHLPGQGSISKDNFYKIINFIGKNNILNAEDFFHRYKEKKLLETNVCLTFDDSLKCQYDIVAPILDEMNIKAFFFIQTSIFTANPDLLEIYRYFRLNFYNTVNNFYDDFFKVFNKHHNQNLEKIYKEQKNKIEKMKKDSPFYSYNDIKFRLVREDILTNDEYSQIMIKMFEKKNFDYNSIIKNLFLSKNDLKQLRQNGHIIGLHSHSHPYKLEYLNYEKQFDEYNQNLNMLSGILNNKEKIISMSHPCGSYNNNTFDILKKLGIEIGFRDNISFTTKMNRINNSKFEIARQDHSYIIKMMN